MTTASPHEWAVHQEEDLLASGRLTHLAFGAAVVFVASVAIAGALLVAATGWIRPNVQPQLARAEISGVLQTPVLDTRAGLDLRAAQRRELDQWGWADRDAGVATIPIDRAIDLVVQEAAQ